MPFIDTRSPGEFEKGAFPSALSLPLMNNEERALVGTCYKEKGQAAAIDLGHGLVYGAVKQSRIDRWIKQLHRHPETVLYCFRGGLRTKISLEWLAEAGLVVPYVEGGYKAMRHFLIETIEAAGQHPWLVVAGKTGSGKTELLKAAVETASDIAVVDLEHLANHRGSAFGSEVTPQPSQINFENALAIELLRLGQGSASQVLIEDEGRLIGRAFVPMPVQTVIRNSDMVELVRPFEERAQAIAEDYVLRRQQELLELFDASTDVLALVEDRLLEQLGSIRRRLGGERHALLTQRLSEAFVRYRSNSDVTEHFSWIEPLLLDYYDPMYEHQASRSNRNLLFRGEQPEILEWLQERPHQPHRQDASGQRNELPPLQ
ncbi:tRNA 2-selenouridine(34) synthase MnmH [Allohahella marinimesophila]|uniref:tRNA 2-selenouridine(34) synthase MnmH n=1 Tax=Allohahella marinimesophila TaxID=1054972 RepID=A0ABP7PVE7_9GAMM